MWDSLWTEGVLLLRNQRSTLASIVGKKGTGRSTLKSETFTRAFTKGVTESGALIFLYLATIRSSTYSGVFYSEYEYSEYIVCRLSVAQTSRCSMTPKQPNVPENKVPDYYISSFHTYLLGVLLSQVLRGKVHEEQTYGTRLLPQP
jgi:hypothetical protein